MAEDDFNEFDEAASSGGGKKKKIPMVVILAVVVIAVAAGSFFAGKMLSGGGDKKDAQTEVKKEDQKETPAKTDEKKAGEQKADSGDTGANPDNNGGETSDASGTGEELVSKSNAGVWTLDPFTVNLNDPFGRRYAEVAISLEITNKNYVAKLSENELLKPRIRDEIFMIISNKGYNELKSASGKVTLKEEIMMRVNELTKEEYGKEIISRVNFTKFIIQ